MHKIFFPLVFVVIFGGLAAASANDLKTTLIVRPDGTCEVKTETTQPRAVAEREVKMWARYAQMADDSGDDEPKPDQPKKEANDKPLTDAELMAKMKETTAARYEQMGEDSAPKIESVDITNDTVRVVQTTSAASIEEFLASSQSSLGENRVWSGTTRFEKDTNGRLVVTFTPDPMMKRYEKNMRRQMKMAGSSMQVRVELPGKIVSSAYSNVQDNATWYDIDPKNDASITKAVTYYEQPVVIVSEMNGLKLDQPLDSKDLAQRGRRGGAKNKSNELPITDAGPGFVAEAANVTTTTAYLFPEGQKYSKDTGADAGQAGAVVRAKLFAPKGRFMRSVSGVKVMKAVDDKGRNIAPAQEGFETDSAEDVISFNSNGQQEAPTQMPMELRLALPERDSQAIQEISGEAVAVTFGKWKEMTVTNLEGEIDLSAVLPGAKMTVKNLKTKNRQTTMQLEIKGPASIRELDVKKKEDPGQQQMSNANLMERGFKSADGQSIRKATLQTFSFDSDDGQPGFVAKPPVLVVRFPEDERRERVKFKLSALDLF